MSAKQVNRGRWLVAFVIGYLVAFVGTAILTYVAQNPMWLWSLFVLVGIWFWQLPDLKDLDSKLTLLSLFAFPFLCVWMFSNTPPETTDRLFIFVGIVLVAGLAISACAKAVVAMHREKPALRKIVLACLLLFVCGWLVAYLSGGPNYMVDVVGSQVGILLRLLLYGMLGLSAYRLAVRGGAPSRATVLALVLVLAFSSFDEIRQSEFPARRGSLLHVAAELLAAAIFAALPGLVKVRQRRGRYSSPHGHS